MSLKYSKENPSRDDKPRMLGLQKNGGCLFPSYHAQKQNLAESETKDFDLVPTVASTEGSRQAHRVTSATTPEYQGLLGAAWERILPCPVPRTSPSGVSPQNARPELPLLHSGRVLFLEEMFHMSSNHCSDTIFIE